MYRLILWSWVFLGCVVFSLQAQQRPLSSKNRGAVRLYEQAIGAYSDGRSKEALDLLNKATERDPAFVEAFLVQGDIFNEQGEHLKELEMLKQAVALDSTFHPVALFHIGVAAVKSGLYEEGLEWLERYKWQFSDDRDAERVAAWMDRARFGLKVRGESYDVQLRSLGEGVNSAYDEYWPSLTADEQTLVFTVLVPRDEALFQERILPKTFLYFQEDFYQSTRNSDGSWSQREPLPGSINTDGNEGAQSLSADGNWMFFTACGRDDGRGSCDIYFAQKTDAGWSEPVNLGMPVNSPYWESQPSFSSDGQTLYFVSNRPGGRGGKDIWRTRIIRLTNEGVPVFGEVSNLGSEINTPGDEASPFIHHDNKTLYFASDGHQGMGGMDLFFSRRMPNGNWRKAATLGYPINTPGDESGLVINARGNRAYFSSSGRVPERDDVDIYVFDLPGPLQPAPVLYVKGRVYDIETGATLPADFELKSLESGELLVSTRSNRFSGEFLVCLPVGGRYAFKASHPGYMFYSGHFDLPDDHPLERPYLLDIGLHPVRTGAKMTLENIFFETNSYELEQQSKVELNGLVDFMNENPKVRIEIGGHTDNVGQAAYNQVLSENRARSVHSYLVEMGVDKERLLYKGFGMTQPVADNATEAGRARNRRTEITIL